MSRSIPTIEQTTAFSEKYIAALKTSDIESFKAIASLDVHFRVLPKSMNGPSVSGIDQVLGIMNLGTSVLVGHKFTIVDMNISPGKIWTHATMQATLINNQPYSAEYIFMVKVEVMESGEVKITALTEFVDAISVQPLVTLVQEKMMQHAAKS